MIRIWVWIEENPLAPIGAILALIISALFIYNGVTRPQVTTRKDEIEYFNGTSLLFDYPSKTIDGGTEKSVFKSNNQSAEHSTDASGVAHPMSNQLMCDSYEGATKKVEIYLGGDFTKIIGRLYAVSSNMLKNCWLEFYDDNNNLLGSSKIVSGTEPSCFVNINVSGVKTLTVHLRSNYTDCWLISELHLVSTSKLFDFPYKEMGGSDGVKGDRIWCDHNDIPTYEIAFELNGEFTTVSGTLNKDAGFAHAWLEFYDENNNFLGSSDIITFSNSSCEVNINVTGVKTLIVRPRSKFPMSNNPWIISGLTLH